MSPHILQSRLPIIPWLDPQLSRLPGLKPIPPDDWLLRDEVFEPQRAYARQLVDSRRDTVFRMEPDAEEPAAELDRLVGADGTDHPLIAARLSVQEDFAILTERNGVHVLTGGCICFPAHWRLSDKIGRTLGDLHAPVPSFDTDMTARSERVFASLRPEAPLMRANYLIYTDPDLHQPQPEGTKKHLTPGAPRYVRVERQTLRRLPETRAVIFAIHTFVVPASVLSQDAFNALARLRPELVG